MTDPLHIYTSNIEEMKHKGLFVNIRNIESGQGSWLKVNGRNVLNFCSNNYLGFANNQHLNQAAISAIQKYGIGAGAVRPLSGNNTIYEQLESKLAEFKKVEATMVLQGGYVANLAAIQTLISKEDIVISDELNHASIIDAVRMSQVRNKFIYKHNDMQDLETQLKEASTLTKQPKSDGNKPIILIVTDGVFSMDGDIAPLPQIVKLAKKYKAVTMVDDAHGEGVLGSHGRGIVDHFNLHGQIDIEVGTLSKAFGVMGGVIAGSRNLIDYYRQKTRQFLFSTGISIPDAAALLKAVQILQNNDKLVKELWKNTDYLKTNLKRLGFNTGKSETPITPVMIGDENKAKDFSNRLFELGVFATPIKYPMVALGTARIRIIPSATHNQKDLDFGLKIFKKVGKELKVI